MPRPKTKPELLGQSAKNFQALLACIDGLPAAEQTADFPPGTLNRNIRDVLGHLYHWHQMMLGWYEAGMAGEKPMIPAPGYTWRTVPDLNREIQAQYAERPLPELRQQLEASHRAVEELIEGHSEEELFEKKRYAWTGSTSLGAYLISATSSHYDWALKLIKRVRKQAKAS